MGALQGGQGGDPKFWLGGPVHLARPIIGVYVH